MEKRHNYAAAGFLLLGIGAAGRAFLGVPEGVTMAELSLTVLLVIGALLLTRQGLAALVCGLAATALELVLCGSWVQAGGALAVAAPFLRLADLWLLLGLVWGSLPAGPPRCGRPEIHPLHPHDAGCLRGAAGCPHGVTHCQPCCACQRAAGQGFFRQLCGIFGTAAVVHRADGQSLQRSAHQTLSIRPFCAFWGAGMARIFILLFCAESLYIFNA